MIAPPRKKPIPPLFPPSIGKKGKNHQDSGKIWDKIKDIG
jgi:hypothetical protein